MTERREKDWEKERWVRDEKDTKRKEKREFQEKENGGEIEKRAKE